MFALPSFACSPVCVPFQPPPSEFPTLAIFALAAAAPFQAVFAMSRHFLAALRFLLSLSKAFF